MRWQRLLGWSLAWLALAGWMFGEPVMAAQPAPKRPAWHDTALGPDGELTGRLLDTSGQPLPAVLITARSASGKELHATTGSDGAFCLKGLSGGLWQLEGGGDRLVVRAWVAGSAPPHAGRTVVLIRDGAIVRGQQPLRDLFFADPIVLGLIIAAAIAIPIAVNQSKEERPSGS